MNAAALARQPSKLATSYTRRFKTLVKWDSRTDLWFAFVPVPVLGPISVCAASRDEAIESIKKAIRSYVDRTAADGCRVPPESYEEVLDVEVPLKGHIT